MTRLHHRLLVVCIAAGLAPSAALAQVTWTGTTGNGDWATANAFASSSGGITLSNGFSQAFVFGGTPAIVSTTNTLTGGTATSITFNSGAGAYTLSGSAITLSGSAITNSSTSLQTINLGLQLTRSTTITLTAGGGNLVLGGPIGQVSGSTGSLNIAGSGTLTLNGSNSYSGATSVNANQTLVLGNANALGTGAFVLNSGTFDVTPGTSLTIANSGTLAENTTFLGSGNLTMTGTMTPSNNRGITTLGTGTLTLASLAGTRSFQKNGAGTLFVSGSSSMSGNFTQAGGLTIFGHASAMGSGSLILSSGTVSSSVILTIANSTGLANNTTIAGTNSITFSGSFANTATGVRELTNNLSAASALLEFTGPVVLRSDANYVTLSGSGNTTLSGTISGGPAAAEALRITSTGTTTLSAANTYSGTTQFSSTGGSLVLGNSAALGSSVLLINTSTGIVRASTTLTATNAVVLVNDPIFGGTNSMTFGALTNGVTSSRQITNNLPTDKTLTFTGTTTLQSATDGTGRNLTVAGSGNTTFSNTIVNGGTAGNGGLTINSTGTTTLQAANSYTGATLVTAGVLMLSNTGALGSGNLRLDTGGVVALNAGDLTRGSGTGAGQVRIVTSGGFAAFGVDRIVAFGGTSAPTALTWGDGVFLGSSGTFVLGAPGATATLDFRNAVALGSAGTTRVVQVNDGPAAVEGNMTGVLSGTANLRKTGPGTLRLSATNTFTGTASIGAGVLEITATTGLRDVARVVIDGGATFRYAGSTATFAKPITVTAATGTGSIANTGGGTLTLSGAISKDNSVLRLTGGVFDVTGVISGATVNASDLLVDGTSTVTLSAVNTYNGPTFVNQSSTLIAGVTNAIPSNSTVTVGDATTTGTFALAAGVTNAIGGLGFGGAGGTLRIATTSTTAALLTAPSGTLALTNGTLDLAGSGSTAGLYNVLSAGSVAGSFASITGTSPAYRVIYSSTSVDYQQRAVFGTVNVTNPASAIITGGTAAFTYTVTNAAQSGGATLSFTGTGVTNVAGTSSGSVAAASTSSAVSGLFYNGVSTGSNQTGTFTVTDPNAFGSFATGTVTVNVYDHASGTAAGTTIALPTSIVGYTGTLLGSSSASITNAAGYRVNLMTTGSTSLGGVSINNVSGVLPGQSAFVSASALLSGSQSVGANTLGQVFNLTYADDSALLGASNNLGSQSITVTGKVLDHALPGFVPTGNITDSYTQTALNVDFGTIDESASMQTFNYFLTNLSSIAYGQTLTAGLDFTGVTADGNGFTSGLTTFDNLTAGGTSSQFTLAFTPFGQGTFNKTFTLSFYDDQSLAGASSRRTLTINASVIVVPEPASLVIAAAGIGLAVAARGRRRRRAA